MNALVIFAAQPQRLATFYAEVLEASVTSSSEQLFDVRGAHAQLTILKMSDEYGEAGETSAPREDVALKPVFTVSDIALALKAVRENDGVVTERSFHYEGLEHCDVVDPEGNVVQLQSHNPAQ
jgi:predicted enzyme related to lactoylglutathione lyase